MRDPRTLSISTLLVSVAALASACSSHADGEGEGTGANALATAATGTTKTLLQANNTSASSLFRDRYTPPRRFEGAPIGVVSNGDNPAATVVAASLSEGAISKVSSRTLLPPGSGMKLFVETQSWFCTNGRSVLSSDIDADECGAHLDIGYATNTTTKVREQLADMKSRGIDGVIVDWQGTSAGKGVIDAKSTSVEAINNGALFAFRAAAEADGAFQFSVMEDEGMKACAAAKGCDVTQAVLSDLRFLNTNLFGSSAYYKSNGHPVVFFFSVDTYAINGGKKIDWAYLRANAPGSPTFVFENAGGLEHDDSGGAFSWIRPVAIAGYPGDDPFATAHFLPDFYARTAGHPTQLTFGSAFKGFDDHVVNGWSKSGDGQRYAGQQCSKTWLDTFRLANAHASSLDGLQLITWDDYEEGTELERGIDNHLAITASVTAGVLDWKIGVASGAPPDCAKAVSAGFDLADTVHHFSVYASPNGDGENLSLVADDLAPSTRSLDLSGKLGSGTWQLFVRAVGQPSITNTLSAPVSSSGGSGGGGDGCAGTPAILEPTNGESVGASIHVRVTAPSCMQAMIAYVDGSPVATVNASAIDTWIPVTMGGHVLNVNGWAGTSEAHASPHLSFTRTY